MDNSIVLVSIVGVVAVVALFTMVYGGGSVADSQKENIGGQATTFSGGESGHCVICEEGEECEFGEYLT
ncbi:hypothetical protein CMO92_03955 [Candidatus Woesearchaeota archaeon]|nr:hypothetical protein [Candidatus Woesearchaeota archaeon]|tara:strand:+ start:1044 stop:1250 length:207 start_codon:yes stop_codon:yes gene_type:complete